MSAHVGVFMPLPVSPKGPAYTCGMLARGMTGSDFAVTIVSPRAAMDLVSPAKVVQVLPIWARYVPYKWVRSRSSRTIEGIFLKQMTKETSEDRIAYIWPDASLNTILELKRRNIPVFREMINCHRGSAKVILDEAYKQLGISPRHGITDESVDAEQAALDAVDFIFCPNAMVEASLLRSGLPASKLVSTSYGWDPQRFSGTNRLLPPCDGITAVFAGSICVRKGCHLLLDYWARSNVRGRLVLAGALETAIKEQCAALLARPDVVVLDYVDDIGSLYRSADIFVFASLEEGGPQVTYEACGCGLPAITTPMGMGRIVRDGQEGLIVDAYDRDGWVVAIRALAEDGDRRRRLGAAAAERARAFGWDEVAAKRRRQMLEHVAAVPAAAFA